MAHPMDAGEAMLIGRYAVEVKHQATHREYTIVAARDCRACFKALRQGMHSCV